MEIRSGHSEMSVISQVSSVEGCPLSGIPLYMRMFMFVNLLISNVGKFEMGLDGKRFPPNTHTHTHSQSVQSVVRLF